jgi:CHAD domain-containing protein
MDNGEIRSGQTSQKISELELELKSGEPAQLFNLALALLDIVPLTVEHTNKAEYGYRWFADTEPAAVRASTPDLIKCIDVPGILQAMIWSGLLHLQANIPGAMQQLNGEYLHQVRVALRRLRVVLSMTETFRADAELSALHKQVAELCVELGRLREWDVFMTQIPAPIRAHIPEQDRLRLLRASEKLRGQQQVAVVDRLQLQDYQRFLLRFGAWMQGDYWREPVSDSLTLPQFATKILNKRNRQVGKRGKDLISANPGQLHLLRIACKKLRYSAEIFASLFDAAKAKHYLAELAVLQEILGALNDIAVAHRLLDELDAEAELKSTPLIRDWIKRDYPDQIIKLNKAWRRFSKQQEFWQA